MGGQHFADLLCILLEIVRVLDAAFSDFFTSDPEKRGMRTVAFFDPLRCTFGDAIEFKLIHDNLRKSGWEGTHY